MFARKNLSLALLALATAGPVAAFAAAPATPVDPAARAEWRAHRQAEAAERRAENRAAHAAGVAPCPRAAAGATNQAGPRWMQAGGPGHGLKTIAYGAPRGARLHAPARRGAAPFGPMFGPGPRVAPEAPVTPQ